MVEKGSRDGWKRRVVGVYYYRDGWLRQTLGMSDRGGWCDG